MIRLMLMLCGLLVTHAGFAIPVEDWGEWIRTAQEIKQITKNYNELKTQYQTMKNQYSAMIGHYGFGNLYNATSDFKNRLWSPGSWSDALHGLSGGNPARYQELLVAYKKAHATMPTQQYQQLTSKQAATEYSQQINTNRAASVNASFAFNTIQSHLQTVHALSQQIEAAPNTKSAIDLNSRLVAELAYIQLQELKMQAVLNEQLAQQSSNVIAEKTAAAKFNQLK